MPIDTRSLVFWILGFNALLFFPVTMKGLKISFMFILRIFYMLTIASLVGELWFDLTEKTTLKQKSMCAF